jgi:hypothetical protein
LIIALQLLTREASKEELIINRATIASTAGSLYSSSMTGRHMPLTSSTSKAEDFGLSHRRSE